MSPNRRPAPRSLTARVKFIVKWTLAQLLYRSRVLHVWLRLRLRNRAVVLAYHRVLDSETSAATWSHPAIVVRPPTFDSHLTALKSVLRILTLAEFEAALTQGSGFTVPSCLITFDDGWVDTYTAAWPALQRAGLPAVIFVAVNYIGSDQTFWQERLGHLLEELVARARLDEDLKTRASMVLDGAGLAALLSVDKRSLRAVIIDRLRAIKAMTTVDPVALLQRIEALLGDVPPVSPVDRFMTWPQVREMASGGIAFGGHGATHRILDRLTAEDVVQEARRSKTELEDQLNLSVSTMSYPNGGSSPIVQQLVRAAGYTLAFGMQRGKVAVGDDQLAVRRINIHEDVASSVPMFLARVAGIL